MRRFARQLLADGGLLECLSTGRRTHRRWRIPATAAAAAAAAVQGVLGPAAAALAAPPGRALAAQQRQLSSPEEAVSADEEEACEEEGSGGGGGDAPAALGWPLPISGQLLRDCNKRLSFAISEARAQRWAAACLQVLQVSRFRAESRAAVAAVRARHPLRHPFRHRLVPCSPLLVRRAPA